MPHKEQHNTQESTFDFDAMFRSYYAPMVLYAMRTTKDSQEAEDMVQEVFCKFLTKKDEMTVKGDNGRGLLFTMLRNKLIDNSRYNARRQSASLTEANSLGTEDDCGFDLEIYTLLYQEVEKLPRKNREVMRMKMKGMDNHDIAEQLGISVETVRTHVKNGVSSLRGKFSNKVLSAIFL